MDLCTLVDRLIDDGQRLSEQLSQNGLEVVAAFWLKAVEDERWYFYLVSPLVESEGISQAYTQFHTSLREVPPLLWLDPLEVKVIGVTDPIAKHILAIHAQRTRHREFPIRWRGKRLGEMNVDDAYLYPLPTNASP
jgi:hypothetical protein